MQVTELSVTVARLIALPNYENVRFETTVKVAVAETEDPHKVYEEALDFAKDKIKTELDRFYPPKKPVATVNMPIVAKAERVKEEPVKSRL